MYRHRYWYMQRDLLIHVKRSTNAWVLVGVNNQIEIILSKPLWRFWIYVFFLLPVPIVLIVMIRKVHDFVSTVLDCIVMYPKFAPLSLSLSLSLSIYTYILSSRRDVVPSRLFTTRCILHTVTCTCISLFFCWLTVNFCFFVAQSHCQFRWVNHFRANSQ